MSAAFAIGATYTTINIAKVAFPYVEKYLPKVAELSKKIQDCIKYSDFFLITFPLIYSSLKMNNSAYFFDIVTGAVAVSAFSFSVAYAIEKVADIASIYLLKKDEDYLETKIKKLQEYDINISIVKNKYFSRTLHIATIVNHMASVIFIGPISFFHIVNIVLLSKSLYHVAKEIWLKIDKKLDNVFHVKYQRDSSPYLYSPFFTTVFQKAFDSFLLSQSMKLGRAYEKNNCAICHNENDYQYYFCKKHIFHLKCLVNSIKVKLKEIRSLDIQNVKETVHVENYTRNIRGYSYTSNIKKNLLPNCPICRQQPESGSFEIGIKRTSESNPILSKVTLVE